jgi:hypothetical protein
MAWCAVWMAAAAGYVGGHAPGRLHSAATCSGAPARPHPPFARRVAGRPRCYEGSEEEDDDLNWLHTRLHIALDAQDFAEAASLRDRIRRSADVAGALPSEAAWSNLGVPDWLCDRLERLNFPLPTRVQLHALRAMEAGDDAAICAPTGSGKTLSYLLPLLSQLSDDLLSEDLSNYLESFLDGGRRASSKGLARRKAITATAGQSNAGDSSLETAVPTPACIIVVPTRELGVQVWRRAANPQLFPEPRPGARELGVHAWRRAADPEPRPSSCPPHLPPLPPLHRWR